MSSSNLPEKCGRSSGVEHNLAKVGVVSSNLIARSRLGNLKHYNFYFAPSGALILTIISLLSHSLISIFSTPW